MCAPRRKKRSYRLHAKHILNYNIKGARSSLASKLVYLYVFSLRRIDRSIVRFVCVVYRSGIPHLFIFLYFSYTLSICFYFFFIFAALGLDQSGNIPSFGVCVTLYLILLMASSQYIVFPFFI